MEVDYTADSSDLDQVLHQAEAANPGQPIRIRIQPQVWISGREYLAWRRVSWPLRCDSVEEAISLRMAMEAFFVAVGARGPVQVAQELYGLNQEPAVPPADEPVGKSSFWERE